MERFHRQLKTTLKAHHNPAHWVDSLPLVLLSIRSTLKEDLKCSAAELVYGTILCLPGEFSAGSVSPCDPSAYFAQLKAAIRATSPRQNQSHRVYKPSDLMSSTHDFVRHDAIQPPLQQPYDGPFKVLHRTDKHFTLDINGCKEVITIDRLKSAHVEETPHDPAILLPPHKSVPPAVTVTRSGRQVRPPNYL